jgi:hypothetical protein
MKTTPKEELRKCNIHSMYDKEKKNKLYLFHGWTQEGMKKCHPEDPQKDCVFAQTFGIVEDYATGKVEVVDVDSITFLN